MKNKIKELLWKIRYYTVMPSEMLRIHMEEFEEAWDIMKECELSKDTRLINIINVIYETEGFQGVLEEVEDRLDYGTVTKMNGLVRISTGGWSEDEMLIGALLSMLCKFHTHYCGYIRGGAFYFCEEKYVDVEMVKVKE